jgi:hypothetical protein
MKKSMKITDFFVLLAFVLFLDGLILRALHALALLRSKTTKQRFSRLKY